MARDHHAEAKTKQTTYANQHRRPEPDYKVGEKAYLETKDLHLHIKQKGRSAKFYSRYVGPFEISKAQPDTSNYTLKLPDEYQIHPKVHARRLKRAHENDPILFPGQVPPEPSPIDAEDNQYIVEAILDHRMDRKKREFLVHWEGYSDIEDSWVKEVDIDPKMVKAFFEGLDQKKENSTPLPKLRRGRSARTHHVKSLYISHVAPLRKVTFVLLILRPCVPSLFFQDRLKVAHC